MADGTCTSCGSPDLEPGFIEDAGEHSKGYLRWIGGELERGLLGGAKRWGKERWQVSAYRCSTCNHLELYAATPA